MKIQLFSTLVLLGLSINLQTGHSQPLPSNFGLTEAQFAKDMPCSRAQYKTTAKTTAKTTDIFSENKEVIYSKNEIQLQRNWKMASFRTVASQNGSPVHKEFDTSNWYDATVPGTVLTTLVDQGVFPDPYFGLNNLSIPDTLCRTQWWYRVEFPTPKEARGRRVELIFNGINYRADIWLNGRSIGRISGAFMRGRFEIGDLLHNEEANVLAVLVSPPDNPGIPHEQSVRAGMGPNGGQLCQDGPTFISSEGWDWIPGIRDRNTGIWQGVKLRISGDLRLGDPQIITDLPLPDTTSANIIVKTSVRNLSDQVQEADVFFTFDKVQVSKRLHLPPHSESQIELTPEEFASLHIENPRLWWPNGYGVPNLHNANLEVRSNGKVSDCQKIRFGIREFCYDLTVKDRNGNFRNICFNPTAAYASRKPVFDMLDHTLVDSTEDVLVPQLLSTLPAPGITEIDNSASPYLTIRVNGKRIFIRGGNWGMDDGMKRVSRQRLEPYIRLHRDQHFNMIRNWTGESTEELFYDLCDEYGILIFNDFSISTEGYNLNPKDNEVMLQNVREIVVRYRNHASIALWCPRNEGFAPKYLDRGFSRIIVQQDGTRHYSGNSIRMNLTKSGPWGLRHPSENFQPTISRGFSTELGTISVPTAETMRRMMAEEDLWPIGDVWSYHDWHVGGWLAFDKIIPYMNQTYGTSANIDDFCRKSQLLNYDAYRAIFESFNSRMWNNTTGILLWMSHPAWPSVAWQTYSYDYETPAAYFGSMKACEAFHPQIRPDDHRIQLVNINAHDISARIRCEVYDVKGSPLFSKEMQTTAKAETVTECFTLDPSDFPPLYLTRLIAEDRHTGQRTINDYWIVHKNGSFKTFNTLAAPDLRITSLQKIASNKYSMTIINSGKFPALYTKLNIRNRQTDEAILPAYFSDGYFTLLPGEQRDIWVEFNPDIQAETCYLGVDCYNGGSRKLVALK